MWPLPRISDESISCVFTPRSISISYLKLQKNKIILAAYQRTDFLHGELEHTLMCNPTKIQQIVRTFIAQNNAHAPVNIALCGPSIDEKITAKKRVIDNAQYTSYLYTQDDKSFYYTTTINPALIMQYQLMAIATQIQLLTITTPFIAQLKLYQTIHGTAFRHTQLAHDLCTHNHRIESIFTDDIITRMIHILPNVTFALANERCFLLSSLGLFYLRR